MIDTTESALVTGENDVLGRDSDVWQDVPVGFITLLELLTVYADRFVRLGVRLAVLEQRARAVSGSGHEGIMLASVPSQRGKNPEGMKEQLGEIAQILAAFKLMVSLQHVLEMIHNVERESFVSPDSIWSRARWLGGRV
jgi:hypothetical protein